MAENLEFICLPSKPAAQLSYRFYPSSHATPSLIVFVNGLGLPQMAWSQTIAHLKGLRGESSLPAILTYDRFGSGLTTDRDPSDDGAADPTHGHDCMTVVRDLRQLIQQIANSKMGITDLDKIKLVFVANSIGCALTRLYAQEYPNTVSGLLLLDSVLANSDFVSIYPDPDAEGFDASSLLEGITADALRESREGVRRTFHPSVGSKEGLSRKNLPALLPSSDSPLLHGPNGRGPFVTVVGHDFEAFAEESAKMGRSKLLTMAYVNPYWQSYNEGLAKITEPERSKGPIQAPGSGHFIQKDNPAFVAQELNEILEKVL